MEFNLLDNNETNCRILKYDTGKNMVIDRYITGDIMS